MSQNTETGAKTCGSPECFVCHLNNAIAAFVGSADPEAPVTKQQAEIMLDDVAGLAGALLAGATKAKGHEFIGKVMIAQRKAEIEGRAQAASEDLLKAIFGSYPTRPRG